MHRTHAASYEESWALPHENEMQFELIKAYVEYTRERGFDKTTAISRIISGRDWTRKQKKKF